MQPKKSLGQNFLRDGEVLRKIIEAADLNVADNVIEIGPGEGILSRELVKKCNNLLMIEKDENLAEKLARNFQFSIFNLKTIYKDLIFELRNKAAVIEGDILEINLPEIIEKNRLKEYKVVANIPYYITSPIIRLFLETKYRPKEMILMVQREVAERICARPGQMSILAIAVQYYAKAEILFEVGRKSFYPIPEVDSAVIKISNIKYQKSKNDTKDFFRIVKAGFSARRKTLANNLANGLNLEKVQAAEIIKKSGLKPTQRAQELSVEDWKKIMKEFISKI